MRRIFLVSVLMTFLLTGLAAQKNYEKLSGYWMEMDGMDFNSLSTLLVFNKLDQYEPESNEGLDKHLATEEDLKINLERFRNSYLQKNTENVVFISATENQNIAELREVLVKLVQERHFQIYPNWDASQNPMYDWQGEI